MKKYVAIALAVLFAVLSFSCSRKSSCEPLLTAGGRDVFLKTENGLSVEGGGIGGRLRISNPYYESLEITVYSENGRSATLSAKNGEKASARSIGGSLAAISVKTDAKEHSYALSQKGLEALLASDAESIAIINNINNEGNLSISRPVSINSRADLTVKGTIFYSTAEEGTLTLSGNISADSFTASAPDSDIFVPENLISNPELYISARSLNGEPLPDRQRKADSIEALTELCSLPDYFDHEGETILLSNVEFTEKFVIPFPCRLKIGEGVALNGNLAIETEDEGEIYLFGDFDYTKVEINAPACNINWDSPCALDKAAKCFNAKSLNGFELKNYTLGGSSSASIISATMKKKDNLCSADIHWKQTKNVLVASFDGVVAPSALKNAKINFEIENGSIKVDDACRSEDGGIDLLSPLGCYVTITDNDGNARKYKIETHISTKLPVVVINTENNSEITDKENYINADLAVESDFSDGLPSTEKSSILIRGRGNSTWKWYDKKPYKIKFNRDVSLLGLCKGKDWVLLANYNDKALMRNYVALEAAKALDNMDCYATQYPVDVFLNGEYLGVYSLGEQIETGDERINLQENASSAGTGFLLEIGGSEDLNSETSFTTQFMSRVEIVEPSSALDFSIYKQYLQKYFDLADGAVSVKNGYDKFIDVDSLIDWFIITEISFNSDGAMRRSVFMTKQPGEKIKMGPVWDYDIAFGNSNTDFLNYEAWCCLATEYNYVYNNWMCILMEDEAFVERLRTRYNEIKDELYDCFMDSIDYAEEHIAPSADANFEKWDILPYQVGLEPYFVTEYDTYEKQVQFLRDFIKMRMDWIDLQLNGEE